MQAHLQTTQCQLADQSLQKSLHGQPKELLLKMSFARQKRKGQSTIKKHWGRRLLKHNNG